MESVIQKINDRQKKKAVVDIRPGDTVRVHQKIREGGKERIQIFEGLVTKYPEGRSRPPQQSPT
jgi:large subunit ribosomal protein L19